MTTISIIINNNHHQHHVVIIIIKIRIYHHCRHGKLQAANLHFLTTAWSSQHRIWSAKAKATSIPFPLPERRSLINCIKLWSNRWQIRVPLIRSHKLIARERCNIMQDPSGSDWPSALGLGMLGGSGDSGDHWWPLVILNFVLICFWLDSGDSLWRGLIPATSCGLNAGERFGPEKQNATGCNWEAWMGGRRNTKDGCFEAKTFFDMFGYCLIFLKYVLSWQLSHGFTAIYINSPCSQDCHSQPKRQSNSKSR